MGTNGKFVAYYRVSTQKQGRSGLGLEAQRHAVAEFLNGGDWKIVGEFTEVESGKRSDRPELARALAMCRLHGARLVIAKLDRLSRNAHFLFGLQEAGVDFVAADTPHANRLTVGIMAIVADEERRMISARTKAAMAAAKARGVQLGGDRGTRLTAKQRAAGRAVQQEQARNRILCRSSKSYRRAVLSHCGPLQRGWRSAAFRQRAAANGLLYRWRGYWRPPPSLSAQAT